MTHLADEYPVRWLCRLFGCPRAGLYRTPAVVADEAKLRAAVERVAGAWPTYGYRRVTAMLRRNGWSLSVVRTRRSCGSAASPSSRITRRTRLPLTAHPSRRSIAVTRRYP